MALGTPVIASDIAGIHEALDNGQCGLLVPPRDVEALTTAIKSLLTNAGQRQVFADRARKRAEEKFDMWRNGRNLADVLRATKRERPFSNSVGASLRGRPARGARTGRPRRDAPTISS